MDLWRTVALFAYLLSVLAYAQGLDQCPEITQSQVQTLIRNSYGGGDDPDLPDVTVRNFRIVCRATGPSRFMYRFLSLVAEYDCDGAACEDANIVGQFDTQCIDGEWRAMVISFSNDEIRTVPANGNFNTVPTSNCSLCLTPERAISFRLVTDTETHCLGKHTWLLISSYVCRSYNVVRIIIL